MEDSYFGADGEAGEGVALFGDAFAPPPAAAAPPAHTSAGATSAASLPHHSHGGFAAGAGDGQFGHPGGAAAAAGMPYGAAHDGPGAHSAPGGQVMARGVRNRELGFTAKARLPEREATQKRIDIARTNLANVPRGVRARRMKFAAHRAHQQLHVRAPGLIGSCCCFARRNEGNSRGHATAASRAPVAVPARLVFADGAAPGGRHSGGHKRCVH